jgi:hypothetical protein
LSKSNKKRYSKLISCQNILTKGIFKKPSGSVCSHTHSETRRNLRRRKYSVTYFGRERKVNI